MRLPEAGILVSYDIGDDRRRLRVSNLLSGAGLRQLYSAFALPDLSKPAITVVLQGCQEQLRDADLVIATPFCPQCLLIANGPACEPWTSSPTVV